MGNYRSKLTSTSNIGNNANVLWKHYDGTKGEEFLVRRQQMHVSILSIGSFVGRLLSGMYQTLAPRLCL